MRLDQLIILKGLAPSRSKAKELIESGSVLIKRGHEWVVVTSASHKTNGADEVKIKESSILKYVSRGGLKLEGALKDFSISVEGLRAFDIGQSTGGFTDCLLQHGAKEVLGIDVGHDQLHEKLKSDSRVLFFEGVHISRLFEKDEIMARLNKGFDLCVIDVSFISILKVFEVLRELSAENFQVLGLIKPQFEVGKSALSKAGVVKDQKLLKETVDQVVEHIRELGFEVKGMVPSPVKGTDGNQEFWCLALKT